MYQWWCWHVLLRIMVRIRYVCGHNLDRVNSQQSHHGSTPPTCFVRRCVELNIYSIDPGRGFAKTPSPHCYVDDKAQPQVVQSHVSARALPNLKSGTTATTRSEERRVGKECKSR